jgi:topoisomerase-4 subunit A
MAKKKEDPRKGKKIVPIPLPPETDEVNNDALNEAKSEDRPEAMTDEELHDTQGAHIIPISGLYENWFLDYASYVILERAVPAVEDGLKPVQRRIMHAMKEMDDGRFNKVANIIGQSMQYHPHGDASIGDAIVNLGQKELLIETQGNWGDVNTGDSAAAPRYIEARLSKFALDVAFNGKTTRWQASYDGRKKEPITLPVKFPLLLAQGVEGIAVGLSTKVLPHNFIELLKGSIDLLKERSVVLYPDFATGGLIDVTNYNDGRRGGKVRVRARIEEIDKKTLVIRDIPYGTTTTGVIESIIKANDSGKIKVKKVIDNTAREVEITIQLTPGVSPDITIDALYAFTECEVSISPNCCVIVDNKPLFLGVSDLLKYSTDNTVQLLKRELEIHLSELETDWHYSSLEKIFIEKKIYRNIEDCETWEEVLSTIDKGLKPYKKLLKREVTMDDIARLTEIKIKRISKFDSFKADEQIKGLEQEMGEVKDNLKSLREYAIKYFENLIKKYGKGKERKTEIRTFDNIKAHVVAIANQKLYVNRVEGFVGTGLKKDEFIGDCSEYDDVIVFRKDGVMTITKVADKTFVGKDIIHVDIFKKNNDRMVYNLIYQDGKDNISMVKRFNVTGITRDKEYDLTKGNKGSKILYFSANANSESEVVTVFLHPNSKARLKMFDFDFGQIPVKARSAQGNILCKHLVKAVKFKQKGASTLGGIKVWYDENIGRLNHDSRGRLLGSFDTDEYILVIYKDGSYELMGFELTNRYEPNDILILEKYQMSKPITAIHYDHENKNYYVKRFAVETQTANKKFTFINEAAGSKLLLVSTLRHPMVKIYKGRKKAESIQETFDMSTFIDVKGWKANGNKIASGTDYFVAELLEPNPELEKEDEGSESKEVVFEIEPPENNIYTDEVPPLKDFKEFKPEKKGGSTKDPGEQKSLF